MSRYICKCGREVEKATTAATTGNRDTGGCLGCPHLLEYGSDVWDSERHEFVTRVEGHECRMSKSIRYNSSYIGNANDKCTLHVYSLDFDFLERINTWLRERYPKRELFGSFDRAKLRAVEYTPDGRYVYSLACAQNRAGIAAKAAMIAEFFDEHKARRDMTPAEEKQKVLEDIRAGIEAHKLDGLSDEAAEAACLREDAGMEGAAAAHGAGTTSSVACGDSFSSEEKPLGAAESEDDNPSVGCADSSLYTREPLGAAFDYSGLDEETAGALRLAENELREAKKTYIVRASAAVAMAHEALCSTGVRESDSGKFISSEDTFIAWCRSVGLSKTTAYQLLQVDRLLSSSTAEEQAVLEALPPTLLYAGSKPSAPAELVQGMKDGDITTNKQYQALLAELKAEQAAREAAEAAASVAAEEAALDRSEQENANAAAMRYKAEADRRAAEQARVEGLLQKREDELAEERRRIRELESRPVEVTGASSEDIARWRREGGDEARKQMAGKLGTLQSTVDKTQAELKAAKERLQGRSDHLAAVEKENARLRAQLAGAAQIPAVPCSACEWEEKCCGLRFLNMDDDAQDGINDKLTGCCAGKRKEN